MYLYNKSERLGAKRKVQINVTMVMSDFCVTAQQQQQLQQRQQLQLQQQQQQQQQQQLRNLLMNQVQKLT